MLTSGYGPARDRLERWRWEMSIRAKTSTSRELRVEINADGHPGYLTTPRMLGEVGLLLSEAGSTPNRSGCLTPSIARGTGSAGRFARAGLRFSLLPNFSIVAGMCGVGVVGVASFAKVGREPGIGPGAIAQAQSPTLITVGTQPSALAGVNLR